MRSNCGTLQPPDDMNPAAAESATDPAPAAKRRKISLACSACRERKIRCDGEKPVCGCCQRRRPELRSACVYEQRGQEVMPESVKHNQSIDDLLGRIHHLERQLASIAHHQPDTIPQSHSQPQYKPQFQAAGEHAEDERGVHQRLETLPRVQHLGPQVPSPPSYGRPGTAPPPLQSSGEYDYQDAQRMRFSRAYSSEGAFGERGFESSHNHVTSEPENHGQTSILSPSSASSGPRYPERGTSVTAYLSTVDSTGLVSAQTRDSIGQDRLDNGPPANSGSGIPVIPSLMGETVESMPSLAQPSSTDAMGAMTAVSEASPEEGESYYGRSSTISFMKEISVAVPSQEDNENHLPSFQKDDNLLDDKETGEPTWQTCVDTDLRFEVPPPRFQDFILPPRPMADHLIQCYWDHVYSLYPFLHKPTVDTTYELLWVSSSNQNGLSQAVDVGLGNSINAGPESRIFHCALNAMFALGCQFSDIPESHRRDTSNSFLRRALTLLQLDVMESGCVALIQTILLLSQYLQSTTFPNRCWNLVGMACRVAQGLGLHVESRRTKKSGLEVEMRRRVWYGCLILDTVLSMTLGRPMMISNDFSVPLPTAVDDEYLHVSGSTPQPIGSFSRTSFFLEAIKLYDILGKILTKIYKPVNHSLGSNTPNQKSHEMGRELSGFDIVVELDTSLTDFYAKLPPELQWPSGNGSMVPPQQLLSLITEKQKNVLQARFLHLRIILYRPIFARFCQVSASSTNSAERLSMGEPPISEDSLIQHFFQARCSASCIRAAMELISLVHKSCRTKTTGAWWYNVFYTYTAGVVVIIAMLCRPLHDMFGTDILDASWKQCQESLKSMRLLGPNPQQCLESLHSLYSRVSSPDMTAKLRSSNDPENLANGRVTNLESAVDSSLSDLGDMRSRYTDPANAAVATNGGYAGTTDQEHDHQNIISGHDSEMPAWLMDIEEFWTGPTFDLFSEETMA